MRELIFCKAKVFRNMACVLFVLMFLTASTEVMAWQRNVSRTGPSGQSATRNITATRSGSGYNRSATFNGPQGNSATHTTQGQWNAENNTWSKSATTTGSGGQTATRATTATRTESGVSRSTSATGPQGNTMTREANGQWDPETKTWSKNVIVEPAP